MGSGFPASRSRALGKLRPARMSLAETMTQRKAFDSLGAGALLATVLAACVGGGALIGHAAGAVGIGVGIGALVGVPASIAAVVVRYRNLH
jgi:hypothetical protein